MLHRHAFIALAGAALFAASTVLAQELPPERSLESLKQETMQRVLEKPQRSMVAGILPADAKAVLDGLKSMDRDEWAAAWMAYGDRYMAEAKALEAKNDPAAFGLYRRAFHYYKLAHYPIDNSPKKKEAYRKAIAAFLAYARHMDPPVEVVRIPFEGKEIVGYLRLPQKVRPAPVVYLSPGLDSRKEDATEGGSLYLSQGIGTFSADMPGTGEAPILASPTADRMFSRALDYLATRPEIDAKRIGFYGASWSGYWAMKMAIVEHGRLKAVVAQGVGAHYYFQPEWQEKALGTREYLMDLFAARSSVYGATTLKAFLDYGPKMSLVAEQLIDKPSAPTLLVNGEKDTQVPIEDLHLLLRHGSPKEAWVNPEGGHMGRSKEWSSQRIAREIVVPWMVRMLKGDAVEASLSKGSGELAGAD